MENLLLEPIEHPSTSHVLNNMTPELYLLGIAVTIFLTLIGVIWKMLHSKIDSNHKGMLEAQRETENNLSNSITRLETSMNARSTEQYGQISNRLSNGSTRMDGFSQELASVRVKLAEDYHTASETRTLIGDLMNPITKQLDRLEYLMIDKRKGDNQ